MLFVEKVGGQPIKGFQPEPVAALTEGGITEAHAEELPDARGKAAMKMDLMSDEPDEDLPVENLLPRPLMAPLSGRHHAVEFRSKNIEDAGDEQAVFGMLSDGHPPLLYLFCIKYRTIFASRHCPSKSCI